MLNRKPELNELIHRMAFYGVPMFGDRDQGMEKSFKKLYYTMVPWQNLWPVNSLGFSPTRDSAFRKFKHAPLVLGGILQEKTRPVLHEYHFLGS